MFLDILASLLSINRCTLIGDCLFLQRVVSDGSSFGLVCLCFWAMEVETTFLFFAPKIPYAVLWCQERVTCRSCSKFHEIKYFSIDFDL